MSRAPAGRRFALSPGRRLVLDFLHYARQVPSYPCDRMCDFSSLVAAREAAPAKISWPVLLMKAYALLAKEQPSLRRSWMRWPWAHVYEHPESVAMVTINRRWQEEDCLCMARFVAPEREPLVTLQAALDHYRHAPVEQVFRKQFLLARLPWPIRRLVWSLNHHRFGAAKARRWGTFGMSLLASQGAYNRAHPTVLTSCVTFGPLDEHQRALMTIIYDHRLLDGSPVASCLKRLEEILNGPIAEELNSLAEKARQQTGPRKAA